MKTDMTIPKLTTLTDEQINVLIAEAQGWAWRECEYVGRSQCPEEMRKRIWFVNWPLGEFGDYIIRETSKVGDITEVYGQTVTAYCTDLNAMAIAEQSLQGKAHPSAITDEYRNFRDALAKLIGCAWYQSCELLRATAKQRACAFLLATGKAVQ